MTTANQQLIDSDASIDEYTDGFVIQTYQSIPNSYIDGLKQERFENSQQRTPEGYYRAASIPTSVIDKWMREGFNFYEEPAKKILARLKLENLDSFITADNAF